MNKESFNTWVNEKVVEKYPVEKSEKIGVMDSVSQYIKREASKDGANAAYQLLSEQKTMKWVKASERLPKNENTPYWCKIKIRQFNLPFYEKREIFYYREGWFSLNAYQEYVIEWLDESANDEMAEQMKEKDNAISAKNYVIDKQQQDIERLKGLIEIEFKKKIPLVKGNAYREEKWQQFKKDNALTTSQERGEQK